ncbi:MAG: transposase [Acidobacteriota bacterium]
MQIARLLAGLTDRTEHVYGEARYAAGSWKQERRVIFKAEVVLAEEKPPKDNPRFVIANMKQTPQWLYEEVYCQRGEIENRIKELHAMEIDCSSCSRFWANQFRVLLTDAAYVLMQELRLAAAGANCARAQLWTLRERFLKLGARVMVSVRRMVAHLPQSFPFLATFRQMALQLGASPG